MLLIYFNVNIYEEFFLFQLIKLILFTDRVSSSRILCTSVHIYEKIIENSWDKLILHFLSIR